MSLFDEIKDKIPGHSVPKQFAANITALETYDIPIESIIAMNKSYAEELEKIEADERASLAVMDKITAG